MSKILSIIFLCGAIIFPCSHVMAKKMGYGYRIELNSKEMRFKPYQGSYILEKRQFLRMLVRFSICLKATGGCKKIHFYIYAKKSKKNNIQKEPVQLFFVREDGYLKSGFFKVGHYELIKKKRLTIEGTVSYDGKMPREYDLLSVDFGNATLKKLKNCEELKKLVEDKFKPILEKEFSEYLACQD